MIEVGVEVVLVPALGGMTGGMTGTGAWVTAGAGAGWFTGAGAEPGAGAVGEGVEGTGILKW